MWNPLKAVLKFFEPAPIVPPECYTQVIESYQDMAERDCYSCSHQYECPVLVKFIDD